MSGASVSGIAVLVERYGLPAEADGQLKTLVELLAVDPEAATTVRAESKILDDHLADSLVALELSQIRAARYIADLGSGAGLPGLPLAIALPRARVALVESNGRKAAFLERATAACGASNALVVNSRAEQWREGLRRADVVTARALAPLDVVVEYGAPLLRLGGSLVVWRGGRDAEVEAAGAVAAEHLGLDPAEPLPVKPYAGAHRRHLHVMSKVRETPPGFPRRPGIARKRPLGAR